MLMDWITCTKTVATVSTVVKCFTSHFSLKQQIKNRAQRWESGVNQIQTLSSGLSCQPSTDQSRMRLDTPQIALLRSGDAQAAIFALFQRLLSPVTVGDGVWQIGEGDGVNLTAASETSTRLPVIKHETAGGGGVTDRLMEEQRVWRWKQRYLAGRRAAADIATVQSSVPPKGRGLFFFFYFPETGAANWNPLIVDVGSPTSVVKLSESFLPPESFLCWKISPPSYFFPIQIWPQLASANN